MLGALVSRDEDIIRLWFQTIMKVKDMTKGLNDTENMASLYRDGQGFGSDYPRLPFTVTYINTIEYCSQLKSRCDDMTLRGLLDMFTSMALSNYSAEKLVGRLVEYEKANGMFVLDDLTLIYELTYSNEIFFASLIGIAKDQQAAHRYIAEYNGGCVFKTKITKADLLSYVQNYTEEPSERQTKAQDKRLRRQLKRAAQRRL